MQFQKTVYTIGHSTHSIGEFIAMLRSFNIDLLIDVRHYPGSRKFPWFNKDNLLVEMPAANIDYLHLEDLGGRRKPSPASQNIAWHHPAFRGYADYMETEPFRKSLDALKAAAGTKRAAYMCSEAVWWRCHRSLISDELKVEGWKVLHIMDVGKAPEHPYTKAATVHNGKLLYTIPKS